MLNPLELEVTLRITVDRDCDIPDDHIAKLIEKNKYLVRMYDWQSVSVRVAEPDCDCFAHQAAREHYRHSLLKFPCKGVAAVREMGEVEECPKS